MSTAIGGEVFIGSKCHGRVARAHIRDWLTYEQNRGRAAWYDGMHFYRYNPKNGCGAKYLALREVTGEPDHKLNSLSRDGFLKHFDPGEFCSYNLRALELHSSLQETRAERRDLEQERRRERNQELIGEQRETARLEKAIEDWVSENKGLKSTNLFIDIQIDGGVVKRVRASCYSLNRYSPEVLAIHRPYKQSSGWKVTHIPSGKCLSIEFSNRNQALKYVRGIINIVDPEDWLDESKLSDSVGDFCKRMMNLVGMRGCELNDMRELVVLIDARRDGRI